MAAEEKASNASVEQIFQRYDADNSGQIDIDEFLAPTTEMRLRFEASDLGDGSLVEAGVDLLAQDGRRIRVGGVAKRSQCLHASRGRRL